MDNDELQAHIKAIEEALANGEIELERRGEWIKVEKNWIFGIGQDAAKYRIKPKPLEYWVNVYPNGTVSVYRSEEDAAKGSFAPDVRVAVRMREVTDGD